MKNRIRLIGVTLLVLIVGLIACGGGTTTYIVTFNSNGGSSIANITNVTSGEKISEPTAPTRSGFTFAGWYKEAGLTNAWNFASDVVIANITLYAKWVTEGTATYTVSFESNGGSVVAQITDITSGDTINAPIAPTRSGFTFAGWYKEVGLVNAWNFASDTVTANITLYAKWTENIPIEFEMVNIPSGTLDRGYASPSHTISLSAFKMSKYLVTQELYEEVMGYNPSYFTGDVNRPVEYVTWYDAVYFCNELSLRDSLTPVYIINDIVKSGDRITSATVIVPDWNVSGYRLPTEAQWEYAAWGGEVPNATDWHFGSDTSPWTELAEHAWFSGNSGSTTHPVGEKLPNQYGLYDMHGNVWEWCWDWYGSYVGTPGANYAGPIDGTWRMIRGGSWGYSAEDTRPSIRNAVNPGDGGISLGFRVVCP